MEDQHQVSADTTSPATPPQQNRARLFLTSRLHFWTRSVKRMLISDWRTHKYVLCAALLACITTTVVVAYYLNHPQPEALGDTLTYLEVVHRIQTQGQLVDALRLPGYPLLIVLVYALAGQDNLAAVSMVQAILFVLATLELYILAALVLRRGWVALFLGLLVGTNLLLLSHVKPLLSEAPALWLLVSLALAVALFVSTRQVRFLWLVTALTLVLFLTRAEWIYVPLPLFGYLLLVARQRGIVRRVLPHVLISLFLLYAVLGDYIYINATQNGFVGVVTAQNRNAFGKVLQYDMQDEAPPQYAAISRRVDSYVAQGIKDPYYILAHEPGLTRNHDALAGVYAWSIIERHPGEFLVKSVPLAFSSLPSFYYRSQLTPTGPFGTFLLWLQSVFSTLYSWNTSFPLCAWFWLLLLCWRRTRHLRAVQLMGLVVLLALYGLALTTLGGIDSYPRLYTPFMPLLLLVVWGSLLSGALLLAQQLLRIIGRLVDHYAARDDITPAVAQLLMALSSMPLFEWADRTMEEPGTAATETTSPTAPSQQTQARLLSASRLRHVAQTAGSRLRCGIRSAGKALVDDWHTHQYALCAALLLLLTTVVVVAYYLNHPQPESGGDTSGYLDVVQRIQTQGRLVNPWRLPGYPLLIVLVYTLAGQGNLLAVSVAQAALFVLATLELYVLAVLVLRRGWAALLIGLLVGTNPTLLSYVKPLMSEALALWLLVSLALAVAFFVSTLQTRFLWLVTALTLALFLTRPEWIYLPLPLFAYLLLVARQQGIARHVLPHALASVVLLYAILGSYIYINTTQNGFVGVTAIQDANAFGKVLQYDMQDEAPPQYAPVSKLVDSYVARGIKNPYYILNREPALARNDGALASAYAWAIIEHHPGEFLAKSVLLALSPFTGFYYESQVDATGPFGTPLLWLQTIFRTLYSWNMYFPLGAMFWLLMLCWRRTRQLRAVQLMGVVVLLALYGLVLTTVGGYVDYGRLHTLFAPLLILVVWGSLLSGALLLALNSIPASKGADQAMAEPSIAAAEAALPTAPSQQNPGRLLSTSRLRYWTHAVGRALISDWRTHKYALWAALLLLLTTVVVVAYYLNHPQPEPTPDTPSYLRVMHQIQAQGQLVDVERLPGYPLLIALVYALAGQDNLAAVSIAQAVLFVLATLELYILAALVLRRGWAAFLIGLLVGTNLTLLSYVKLIMSEALALWLFVSLALAVALFVSTWRVRFLWLVTAVSLVLFLTRPEWIYLPLPLFGYLLLLARQQGVARRLLPHALASVVLLYAVLGNYIYINALTNDFAGVTDIQNINAFGKVLQYDMQDEAPPEYTPVSKLVDSYLARGIKNPYDILDHEPALTRNNFALVGAYAWAIIEHHPGEFLAKSVPLALSSLTILYAIHKSQVAPTGPFGTPLLWSQSVFRTLHGWNTYFPLCAGFWLLLLCWRQTRQLRSVQLMGAIVLLALYGLILTTLGGYNGYARLHTPFMPLLILVVWSTLLSGALLIAQQGPGLLAWLTSHYFRRQQVSISTATILIASLGGVGLLLFMARLLLTHGASGQLGVVFFFVLSVVSIFRYFRPSEQK
jgi:hypothetical protein